MFVSAHVPQCLVGGWKGRRSCGSSWRGFGYFFHIFSRSGQHLRRVIFHSTDRNRNSVKWALRGRLDCWPFREITRISYHMFWGGLLYVGCLLALLFFPFAVFSSWKPALLLPAIGQDWWRRFEPSIVMQTTSAMVHHAILRRPRPPKPVVSLVHSSQFWHNHSQWW